MSLRTRKIPAIRGDIYDKNNVRLAWTEKHYNLYLNTQNLRKNEKENIFNKLKIIFPNITKSYISNSNKVILIHWNLTPNELKSSLSLIDNTPSLYIKPYFLRKKINIPEIKKYLGKASFNDKKWIIISGIEKKYNTLLEGEDGLFTVLLDKKGKWIKGTSIIKKRMIPGNNLYLKESIEDIINKYNIKNKTSTLPEP